MGNYPAVPKSANAAFSSRRLRLQHHFTGQSHTLRNSFDTSGKETRLTAWRGFLACYLHFIYVWRWIFISLWLLWKRCVCHWQKARQTDRWWGAASVDILCLDEVCILMLNMKKITVLFNIFSTDCTLMASKFHQCVPGVAGKNPKQMSIRVKRSEIKVTAELIVSWSHHLLAEQERIIGKDVFCVFAIVLTNSREGVHKTTLTIKQKGVPSV